MPRYWVMRVDHRESRDFLWSELQAGRLRQGWGYVEDQDLATIAARKAKGKALTEAQRDTWRGNRRMLGSEPGSISAGDVILVPHLPDRRRWSLARVTGPYRYAIPDAPRDYGHILPVELLTKRRAVHPHEQAVSASLRRTIKARQRLWNIDDLGADVEAVVRAIENDAGPADPVADRLEVVLAALETAGWKQIDFHFQGAELERPCVRLLKALYGEGNVEHTGGPNEKGADAICSHLDPLGVQHRVAVQIKMWEGIADWTRPLDQIERACESYDGITSGVILSTSTTVSDAFEKGRLALERKLKIPIKMVLRRELIRLFLAHLPALVGDGADARDTFAALLPAIEITGPTQETDVTNLAWDIGNACGLKLVATYQLPRDERGAHRVVFVVRGVAAEPRRAALLGDLRERAGGLAVELGPHPAIEIDLGAEPASSCEALVATFSAPGRETPR